MKKLSFSLLVVLMCVGFACVEVDVSHAQGVNLIPDQSVETAVGEMPSKWLNNSWGQNTAVFSYPTGEAQDGDRYVEVQMTSHISGDAKWYFEYVEVNNTKQYYFSDYYKSSVITETVACFLDANNNPSYQWLGENPASDEWVKSEYVFDIPDGTVKLTVFHVISSVGYLKTDNFVLKEVEEVIEPYLIPNQSVETAIGSMPSKWLNNSWGQNTASFSYPTGEAQDGDRYVEVQMTSQTSGDAKWYFEHVEVDNTKQYYFSDYYKSDVITETVACFLDTNGNPSYQWLGNSPASDEWIKSEYVLDISDNTVKLTVFHVISSVGYLKTDNFVLKEVEEVIEPYLIPNQSVETAVGEMPSKWLNNSWGQNTAVFSYPTGEAQDGDRYVEVQMTSHISGDAKWYFEYVEVNNTKQYYFSDYYKSSVITETVACFLDANNNPSYQWLGENPASDEWVKSEYVFDIPDGTVKLTVFHVISSVGYLKTDNFVLKEVEGFNRGIVTLCFDDGHKSVYETGFPIFEQFGYKTTQFLISETLETPYNYYMTTEQMNAFYQAGHEIGSHTITHPDLTQLSPEEIEYELSQSKADLEALFPPIKNFAAPYGAYNEQTVAIAKEYYDSHRTVDLGYNTLSNFDRYKIKVQYILDDTTSVQVQEWVDSAYQNKSWLVLLYHHIDVADDIYSVTSQNLTEHLNIIDNSGIAVFTTAQALDEITPQLPTQ